MMWKLSLLILISIPALGGVSQSAILDAIWNGAVFYSPVTNSDSSGSGHYTNFTSCLERSTLDKFKTLDKFDSAALYIEQGLRSKSISTIKSGMNALAYAWNDLIGTIRSVCIG